MTYKTLKFFKRTARFADWSNYMKKTENTVKPFADKDLADCYEALCCIAIKLDSMMSIFEKLDKIIDKRNGV